MYLNIGSTLDYVYTSVPPVLRINLLCLLLLQLKKQNGSYHKSFTCPAKISQTHSSYVFTRALYWTVYFALKMMKSAHTFSSVISPKRKFKSWGAPTTFKMNALEEISFTNDTRFHSCISLLYKSSLPHKSCGKHGGYNIVSDTPQQQRCFTFSLMCKAVLNTVLVSEHIN